MCIRDRSTLVQSFMWGSDLSGSPQGAGGVGGLLEVSSYGTCLLYTSAVFAAGDQSGGNRMAVSLSMNSVPPKISSANQRLAAVAVVAVAGVAATVYCFNPSVHHFYPVCLFHQRCV